MKKEKNGIQRFRELVPRIREDGWTSGRGVDGWMIEWVDAWTGGCVDGWMNK